MKYEEKKLKEKKLLEEYQVINRLMLGVETLAELRILEWFRIVIEDEWISPMENITEFQDLIDMLHDELNDVPEEYPDFGLKLADDLIGEIGGLLK